MWGCCYGLLSRNERIRWSRKELVLPFALLRVRYTACYVLFSGCLYGEFVLVVVGVPVLALLAASRLAFVTQCPNLRQYEHCE